MKEPLITRKTLIDLGFPKCKAVSVALKIIETSMEDTPRETLMDTMRSLAQNPEPYRTHEELGVVANEIISHRQKQPTPLLDTAMPYEVFGSEGIDPGAILQMETAMRLPVTRAGALMPDAHIGYGLPIGGVLATENAVIPYAVGVDIGCRMCLSLFDLPVSLLASDSHRMKEVLNQNSRFGKSTFRHPLDDAIMEREEFKEIDIAKRMKDRAWSQLGSSGGGNHFVEFGTVTISSQNNRLGVAPGEYLALLSHSGSRGLGASIAKHYTDLAKELCPLPSQARHLAWLDLNSAEGTEYWAAMTLAGDYASACHHQVHHRFATALGAETIRMVENHHNFAWKETDAQGRELIVHRKGATPAGEGILGIIPGSMTAPGFIVSGKGKPESIDSASHGAGRQMSRTQAKNSLLQAEVSAYLEQHGVEVIGSGLDEAPMAYKDIHQVMDYQQDLVNVEGTFSPRIVRMCGDKGYFEVD
ncbi:RtcB family protein [Roseivirga sp. BDSF3-8]|uniref:RtcB family protein n=1 Tax=Roseivirga sp. BDSF3-8 TaxID=3241598 RepID=UPI00353198F8